MKEIPAIASSSAATQAIADWRGEEYLRRVLSILAILLVPTLARADITPRWEILPISSDAMAEDPALVNALCAQLVVDLTGTSLFNVGGMWFDQWDLPGANLYHHPLGNKGRHPNDPLWPGPAAARMFDTNVFTTSATQAAALPGPYIGAGAVVITNPSRINVAWGATPNTGPAGGTALPIARITFLNAGPDVAYVQIEGEVRSNDAPNVQIPLPPMPVPARLIPEPAGAAAVLFACLLPLRRQPRWT